MGNPSKSKSTYVVAKRRAITTSRGILEEGQSVDETQVDIKSLLAKKAIVKR